MENVYKTPEYTRNAIKRYKEKKKYIQIAIDREDADRMKTAGITPAVIRQWMYEELARREK